MRSLSYLSFLRRQQSLLFLREIKSNIVHMKPNCISLTCDIFSLGLNFSLRDLILGVLFLVDNFFFYLGLFSGVFFSGLLLFGVFPLVGFITVALLCS